jgi:prepilin-type N-terminal cleavage/methylation domain-containing protein
LLKQHASDVLNQGSRVQPRTHTDEKSLGLAATASGLRSLGDSMRRTQGLATFGGRKRSSGFTMIEVLVVIVILAILSSLAIPGFTRWLPNYRLNGATRDFFSNIQLAKSLAIRDRAASSISFSDNTYTVTRDGSATPFKTVNLGNYGSGVSFGNGSAADDIKFNPMGMTMNNDEVLVTITNTRGTLRTIRIYPSGAASLEN